MNKGQRGFVRTVVKRYGNGYPSSSPTRWKTRNASDKKDN